MSEFIVTRRLVHGAGPIDRSGAHRPTFPCDAGSESNGRRRVPESGNQVRDGLGTNVLHGQSGVGSDTLVSIAQGRPQGQASGLCPIAGMLLGLTLVGS